MSKKKVDEFLYKFYLHFDKNFNIHQSSLLSILDHLYLPPLLKNVLSSNPDMFKAACTPTSNIEGEGSFPPLEQSRNLMYSSRIR